MSLVEMKSAEELAKTVPPGADAIFWYGIAYVRWECMTSFTKDAVFFIWAPEYSDARRLLAGYLGIPESHISAIPSHRTLKHIYFTGSATHYTGFAL